MALTLEELKSRLTRIDEISLLEVLDIDSEMLVERFWDLIERKHDELEEDFEQDDED
jgi:anion-transporting  ArsA/GET3 family ATPase